MILPNKPLNNFELEDAVKKLKIPCFRGVFLLDTLPKKPSKKECGIVNFDKSGGPGTHWVAWYKNGKNKIYFDSYGVQPPIEVINYSGKPIRDNTDQVQPVGQVFCRHLCLYVLKELSEGHEFQNVLNNFLWYIKILPVDKFGRMSDTKTRDTGVSLTYINNNYIRSDGTTPVSGSINMNGNTLYNVPDPVNPQDVATKEYADNVRGGGWINRKQDGTYAIKRDLDIDGKKLKIIPPPVDDADAVNKIYADTLSDETKRYVISVTPFINQQNQYVTTNNINMRDFTLQNVGEPTNDKDVATKGYVDNSGGGAFEARNGGYNAEGPLYIGGHKIAGVKDPKKVVRLPTRDT